MFHATVIIQYKQSDCDEVAFMDQFNKQDVRQYLTCHFIIMAAIGSAV